MPERKPCLTGRKDFRNDNGYIIREVLVSCELLDSGDDSLDHVPRAKICRQIADHPLNAGIVEEGTVSTWLGHTEGGYQQQCSGGLPSEPVG
jgi:hypothetical protein